jgi:CDGSH-type Zn-finger protein
MANPPGRKIKGPFADLCAAGKHAWCSCGQSTRYPYCDGTHRGSAATPVKIVLEVGQTVVWCACGETSNRPFCDGTHCRL